MDQNKKVRQPLPFAWHPALIKGLRDANIAAQYGKTVKHCAKKPFSAERKHHSAFFNYLQLLLPVPSTLREPLCEA